jgi:hypothetical protein
MVAGHEARRQRSPLGRSGWAAALALAGLALLPTAPSAAGETCSSSFSLDLSDVVVDTLLACDAGLALRVGAGVQVTAAGDLTLTAGERVELSDGFSVQGNGSLRIDNDPSLRPETSGLYLLGAYDTEIPVSALTNPDVVGVSMRLTWEALEPQEGALDTSFLESEIEAAKAAGKKIQLRIISGRRTPAWVYPKGVPSLRYLDYEANGDPTGEINRVPVPWNPVYLNVWTSFINRLGQRIGDEREVELIHLTGATSRTAEMGLAEGADLSDPNTEYLDPQGAVIATGRIDDLWIQSAGYTVDTYRDAWTASADAWAQALPHVRMALNLIGQGVWSDGIDDENPTVVAALAAAYPERLALQNNAFRDRGSVETKLDSAIYQWIRDYAPDLTTGFQYGQPETICGGSTPSGDLGPALAAGHYIWGADYFELYGSNVRDFQPVALECNEFLLGSQESCGTAGPLLCNLDIESPTVTIVSPSHDDVVAGKITIDATATDNTLVFGVRLRVDGADVGEELIVAFPAAEDFSWKVDTAGWSAGAHTLSVIARDVAGNTGAALVTVTK